jgi:hypothetical protein
VTNPLLSRRDLSPHHSHVGCTRPCHSLPFPLAPPSPRARERSPMGMIPAPRAHETCPLTPSSHSTIPVCPPTSRPALLLARRMSLRRVQDPPRPRSSPLSGPGNLSVVAPFAPTGRVSAHIRARALESARVQARSVSGRRANGGLWTGLYARDESGHAAAHDGRNERGDRHVLGATRRGAPQRLNRPRTTGTRSTTHGFSSRKEYEE